MIEPVAQSAETQTKRRVKYGLNVAVAALLALILIVLINWIAYRHYFRIDWTATRQYSLSDQTRLVLKQLDGDYRVVTLLSQSGAYIDQARDLIDEYGRYTKHLSVEHMNPSREPDRFRSFSQSMIERYKDGLEPVKNAIEAGRDTLKILRQESGGHLSLMSKLLEDESLGIGELKEFLQNVAQAFARFDQQFQGVEAELSHALDQERVLLPDYDRALGTLKTLLNDLEDKVFAIAIERFEELAEDRSVPDSIRKRIIGLNQELKRSRDRMKDGIETVRSTETDDAYDKLRRQLTTPETIALIGPKQIKMLEIAQMFREPAPNQMKQLPPGQQPQLSFLGEEVLTGALVGMQREHKPMVVFVSRSQRPVLGPGGQFGQVAARLGHLDFQVEQWNTRGGMTQFGQPSPPGPPPEPVEGQRVVWVVPPGDPPDPRNPMGGTQDQGVVDQLKGRLEKGDAALFLLGSSPMMRFNPTNPIRDLVADFGITVMLDRVIFRERVLPDRRTQPSSQHEINTWPDALPITRALAGMQAVFVQASPIELRRSDDDDQRIKTWPLVELNLRDMWAESEFTSPDIKPSDETRKDKFLIGAAAEKDGARLVVVADPAWATDQITNYGMLGPGSAPLVGALFPGNGELFLNSMYWLAGLDQLIAASARTQDIRRIQISVRGTRAIQRTMPILLPLVVLACGIGVWFVRRKV